MFVGNSWAVSVLAVCVALFIIGTAIFFYARYMRRMRVGTAFVCRVLLMRDAATGHEMLDQEDVPVMPLELCDVLVELHEMGYVVCETRLSHENLEIANSDPDFEDEQDRLSFYLSQAWSLTREGKSALSSISSEFE